jgi:hypothetical protein
VTSCSVGPAAGFLLAVWLPSAEGVGKFYSLACDLGVQGAETAGKLYSLRARLWHRDLQGNQIKGLQKAYLLARELLSLGIGAGNRPLPT